MFGGRGEGGGYTLLVRGKGEGLHSSLSTAREKTSTVKRSSSNKKIYYAQFCARGLTKWEG